MICSRCHKEHDRDGQRLCRECHAENMRKWRAERHKDISKFKDTINALQTIRVGQR